MAAPSKQYNVAFESLRGIAAFIVVITHLIPFGFGSIPMPVAQLGVLGVNIFFTLSGFLIARCVIAPPTFNPASYFRARVNRILPNYFICLILVLLIGDARPLMHDSAAGQLGNLLSHITLTHGWFDAYHVSIVGPFWTLSSEWWFYIFMMAVAGFIRRGGWLWVAVGMAVAALMARLGQYEQWWQLAPRSLHPLCLLDQFAFGIAAAVLAAKFGDSWRRHKLVLPLVFGAGAVITGVAIHSYYEIVTTVDPGRYSGVEFGQRVADAMFRKRSKVLWFTPALALGIAAMLAALWVQPGLPVRWLRFTPLPWMGRVSYSTYLWHAPIILCFARTVRRMPPESPWADPWASFWLIIALIYGFSAVAYQFFEAPWLKSQQGTASGAAAP